MRLVYIVDDLESVTAWIDVLVCLYTVASDVDISLDLRLLHGPDASTDQHKNAAGAVM